MLSIKKETKSALSQILAVLVKNILMFSLGMGLGFRTVLIGGIASDDSDIMDDELSWLGSVLLLAVVLGSLLSGFITQPLGRKRAMQLVAIPFTVCWIIFYFATKIWQFYCALSIMGFFAGIVEGPFSTYVSEITQPYLRGALAASGSMAIVLGVFIQFLLGSFYYWRICALISSIFPTITFFLFFFTPESPQWLLANNKIKKAKKELAWLRGWTTTDQVEIEIQEIIKSSATKNNYSSNCLCSAQLPLQFMKKQFLWPFGLVTLLFFLTHFTGASTLQTYAIPIFLTLNVPLDVYTATVALGLGQVIGSFINIFLVKFLGKRRLCLISLLGICVCNLVVATCALQSNHFDLHLRDSKNVIKRLDSESYSLVSLIFLILLSFLEYCGIHSLPWILITEVYSYETRAVGTGISSAVGSFCSFLTNKSFLLLISIISFPGTYYFYSVVGIISIIIVYFCLPETEGKSLDSVISYFAGISTIDHNKHEAQVQVAYIKEDKYIENKEENSKLEN